MKRILVTGASGFVGRHALSALAVAGPSDLVVGLGREVPELLPPGATYRTVDICDGAALSDVVAEIKPTHILHLAAMASVQQAASAPNATWRVNVGGLLNLVEAVTRLPDPATFIFVSSGEVYGRAFLSSNPIDEDVEPDPLGSYALSKRIGEQIIQDILKSTRVRLIILRAFHHIGPGQDERFVVSSFAAQIARIEGGIVPPILEVGNLKAERDFLPVRDVVEAYVSVIAQSNLIESGMILNIASGTARSIESILFDLRRNSTADFKTKAVDTRMRPSEIPISIGNSNRLRNLTGWKPKHDWDANILDVLADARARVRATQMDSVCET